MAKQDKRRDKQTDRHTDKKAKYADLSFSSDSACCLESWMASFSCSSSSLWSPGRACSTFWTTCALGALALQVFHITGVTSGSPPVQTKDCTAQVWINYVSSKVVGIVIPIPGLLYVLQNQICVHAVSE